MVYNEYIALANPYEACELCTQYGLEVNAENPEGISDALSIIVAENGEAGLKDVMEIHPDKQVILELSAKAKKFMNFNGTGHDGECQNCGAEKFYHRTYPNSPILMAASGDTTATTSAIQTQTGVMMQQSTLLVVGVVVIVAVLLLKNR